jgi:hypothetical protein
METGIQDAARGDRADTAEPQRYAELVAGAAAGS